LSRESYIFCHGPDWYHWFVDLVSHDGAERRRWRGGLRDRWTRELYMEGSGGAGDRWSGLLLAGVELVDTSLLLLFTKHCFIAVLFLGKSCCFCVFHTSEKFPQDLKTELSLWMSYAVLNYTSKSNNNIK
jgi:hypothetical protein